jgi:hypothetical protein
MEEQKMTESNTVSTLDKAEVKDEKKSYCGRWGKISMGKKIIKGIVVLIIVIAAIQVVIADKYRAQVAVIAGDKKVGVNPTTEMLDFGDLSGDTSATRLITMTAGGMDTYVHVMKFGSIAELIKVSENDFTMKKGDTKKLEFAMYMPPSAQAGQKYNGNVWIFKIPKIW